MPNPSAQPAQKASDQQNPSPHNRAPQVDQDLQRQVAQALQPTLAQLQAQMTRTVEQQFEPMRERLQVLAQQQLGTPLRDALQQPTQAGQPEAAGNGQIEAPHQNIIPQEAAPAEVAVLAEQGEESALQKWGESLEGVALMVLALGEVLEGIALLLQAIAYFRDRGSAAHEDHEVQGYGEEDEEKHDGGERGPSAPKKLWEAVEGGVSSLTHVLDRKKGEEVPPREDQDEKARAEGKNEGGSSFLGIISEAASHSVSSLKEALSHVTGDGASSQRGLAALEQWGIILERASTLMQDLGKLSKQKGETGLASMGKWLKIYRSAHALVDELKQTFGDAIPSRQSQGGSGALSKIGDMLGDDSASKKKEDTEASEGQQGGASSALKALAGHSSSKNKGEEGGGLLDALTDEDSPLQTLREFSKRQEGPGGLAPKGPIGRKPPPGPLRRDRQPGPRS
ncbi:MAG TPA: hypothetical protein VH540_17395 [Ktedonobacterales bacterium]|jgi:hypothetical protein